MANSPKTMMVTFPIVGSVTFEVFIDYDDNGVRVEPTRKELIGELDEGDYAELNWSVLNGAEPEIVDVCDHRWEITGANITADADRLAGVGWYRCIDCATTRVKGMTPAEIAAWMEQP